MGSLQDRVFDLILRNKAATLAKDQSVIKDSNETVANAIIGDSSNRRKFIGTVAVLSLSNAGCIETIEQFQSKDMVLSEFVFIQGEPESFGEYTENTTATYTPGEVVRWYVELSNVKVENGQYSLGITMNVQGPGIFTDYSDYSTMRTRTRADGPYSDMFFWQGVHTDVQAPEGSYDLRLEIWDQYDKETIFVSENFFLDG